MIQIGQLLNNTYKIIELLGSGGGGIVYKAYHTRLEKYVAIKLIKEKVKGHINERTETDILKNLKHESLPQVFDFIEDGDDVYTVMEYIDGGSLFDCIVQNGKLSYRKSLEWARELCAAAAYLHTRKPRIIHSDIKPQNIMITPEGGLCLIDFNISSVFGGGIYTVGSSDGYSPPEQYLAKPNMKKTPVAISSANRKSGTKLLFDESDETEIIDDKTELISDKTEILQNNIGTSIPKIEKSELLPEGVIDARSDVYSIGAVMYSMITGRKPANSRSDIVPLRKIDENIPEAYAYIVEKAMSKDKGNRFSSAVEMLDALNKINRLDRRYKNMRIRQMTAYIFCLLLLTGSVISIMAGKRLMETESSGRLNEYVSRMAEMRENSDFEGFDSLFENAVSEYPSSAEPHYYKAYKLYKDKMYDNAAEYINANVYGSIRNLPQNQQSDTYFMLADIYYRNGDYENASPMYEKAIGFNPENPDIYRDYAVVLSRSGDSERAEHILELAEKHGLSEDGIYSVKGEIQLNRNEYKEALNSLKQAIEISDDKDIRSNAYLNAVKAYDGIIGSGDKDLILEKIDMLEKADFEFPLGIENGTQIQEYLIQAYIDYGVYSDRMDYFAKAIHKLEIMKRDGWSDYRTEMNIASLAYKIGNSKGARDVLLEMLKSTESDYSSNRFKIYALLAYCEADIQSLLENSERDYSDFEYYYQGAAESYEAYREEHGSDPDMDRLKQARDEMVRLGWLN